MLPSAIATAAFLSLLITCSGVCLLVAFFPPFYGPILTFFLDQFWGAGQVAYEEQASLIDLVNRILASKHINPSADTKGLEKEIDWLVYYLYGLTDEESAVVEGPCRDEH